MLPLYLSVDFLLIAWILLPWNYKTHTSLILWICIYYNIYIIYIKSDNRVWCLKATVLLFKGLMLSWLSLSSLLSSSPPSLSSPSLSFLVFVHHHHHRCVTTFLLCSGCLVNCQAEIYLVTACIGGRRLRDCLLRRVDPMGGEITDQCHSLQMGIDKRLKYECFSIWTWQSSLHILGILFIYMPLANWPTDR